MANFRRKLKVQVPHFLLILKRFYRVYAYKHKAHILILFLGAVISGVLEILGIIGLYMMVQLLISINDLPKTHFLVKVFSFFNITSSGNQLLFLGLSIASIFIGKNVFVLSYYYLQHRTLRLWNSEISSTFMRGYLNAPYSFLLGYDSATILRNINSTVSSALNGFVLSAFHFMTNIVTGSIILSLIYVQYLSTSLLVAAILVISTGLQNIFMKKKSMKLGRDRDILIQKQSQNVYQGIHAIKETKVLGKEDFFMRAFNDLNYSTIKNDSSRLLLNILPSYVTEVVIIISTVVICISVLSDPNNSSANSLASLGVLAAIAFRIAPIMNRTLGSLQGMNQNTYSINTMFSELDKLDRLITSKKATSPTGLNFCSNIQLKDVSLQYPGANKLAVDKLNFTINKGEFVGIVGPSGAGKTTIVDILLGLLEPTSGAILIDGVRLDVNTLRSWQDKLSFVPQSIYLSNDTLKSNIAFGVDGDNVDKNRINDVISKAHLNDLVLSKEKGKMFKVGENGKNLSGGQKQRIAIARALYLDKEILLLDEATSALDLKTEFEITKVLREQAGEKTVIAVAHRLSTVFDADKIIFMEDGRIVDIGKFNDLVARNRKFLELSELAKITSS